MANKISVLVDVTVDRANTALKGFQNSIKNADGAVGKLKAGTKSMGDSLKANIMPVAVAAGAAVAAFAAKSINAASDLEESTNAVNKSFGEAAEGVLAIGENAAESFGLSKTEFNEAAVAFSSFAKEVAGPGGDVSDVIAELTTRAADFASVMNISVAEASTVFRSGLSGETEPLKRFGINLSAAAVEAYALANGLAANKKEMTEAVKVQARYGLLLEKTAMTAGDFADTSEGLANTTRIAQAKITDFQAEIGAKLIPTVAAAANVAMDLADALERVGLEGDMAAGKLEDSGFFGNIKQGFEQVLNPAAGAVKVFGEVSDRIDGMTGSGEDLEPVLRDTSRAMVQQSVDAALLEAATRRGTEATQRSTAEIERKSDAMEDARQATIRATQATLGAIDADLGYRQSMENTNAVLADVKASALDVESAVLSQASAALQLAEDQAEANGKTLTASDRNRVYRDELMQLVGTIDGPAAAAIQRHIDALNRIPRTVQTALSVAGRAPSGSASGYRASGGPVGPGGTYVVGEDGPELLQMGAQSGHVTNAAATSGMMGLDAAGLRAAVADGMVAGWKRVQQMGRAS